MKSLAINNTVVGSMRVFLFQNDLDLIFF